MTSPHLPGNPIYLVHQGSVSLPDILACLGASFQIYRELEDEGRSRDPGSPKLRMVSWNLNTITMRFVSVIGHPNHLLRI